MIYKNIFLSFFLLGLCLIGFSCKKFFTEKGKELTEQPLARVNEIFLYPSDIAGMGSGNTRQDSIKIVNGYILDWVQRNLIIDKAEKNLPKELLDIDKKVDNRSLSTTTKVNLSRKNSTLALLKKKNKNITISSPLVLSVKMIFSIYSILY